MKYEFKLNGINESKEIHATCSSLRANATANPIQKFQFTVETLLHSVYLILSSCSK